MLGVDESTGHPQLRARRTYLELDGVVQPAPAPRLSRTPAAVAGPPPRPGQHTDEVLAAWRHTAEEIAHLREVGAVS